VSIPKDLSKARKACDLHRVTMRQATREGDVHDEFFDQETEA